MLLAPPARALASAARGYFRLTAFGDAAKTKEAAARIVAALKTL